MGINKILLVAAFVCFVLATIGVGTFVVNLVPLGLALWCLSGLV